MLILKTNLQHNKFNCNAYQLWNYSYLFTVGCPWELNVMDSIYECFKKNAEKCFSRSRVLNPVFYTCWEVQWTPNTPSQKVQTIDCSCQMANVCIKGQST